MKMSGDIMRQSGVGGNLGSLTLRLIFNTDSRSVSKSPAAGQRTGRVRNRLQQAADLSSPPMIRYTSRQQPTFRISYLVSRISYLISRILAGPRSAPPNYYD